MTIIAGVTGREILDSRGNPTVEVEVVLDDGDARPGGGAVRGLHRRARGGRTARRRQEALRRQGRAARPSRTSTSEIAEALVGLRRAPIRRRIDRGDDRPRRHAEQGQARARTPSSASRWRRPRAAAESLGLPLYRYLGGPNAQHAAGADDEHPQRRQARRQHRRLPGVHGHAGRRAVASARACAWGAEIFHALKKVLHDSGLNTGRRRRGRVRPEPRSSNDEALELIVAGHRESRATSRASRSCIALDPAATEFYEDGKLRAARARAGQLTSARDGRLLDATLVRQVPDRLASRTAWPRTTGTAGRS